MKAYEPPTLESVGSLRKVTLGSHGTNRVDHTFKQNEVVDFDASFWSVW